MRTIKFRAWHPELKKMLYPPFGFDSMLHARDSDGKHVIIELPNGNKVPFQAAMIWDGRMYIQGYSQHVEFLQFIGLHDKTGKEIYEGDLIRSRKFYFEVRWINAAFHLINRTEFKYGPRHYAITQKNVKSMEVIGNIYQNTTLSPTTEVVER